MKNLSSRIGQLERRTGVTQGGWQLIVMQSGAEFALDLDTCVDILTEFGFVRTGPVISALNFLDVPHDLNGEELKRYLREPR